MTNTENQLKQKCILAVVDDPVLLRGLRTVIGIAGYMLSIARTADEAMSYLNTHAAVDLLLLDTEIPGIGGYELLKKIKSNVATSHIPAIFLTASESDDSELEGLTIGAIDCISKTTQPLILLKRIEVYLLAQSQKQKIISQQQELMFQNQQLADFNKNFQQMVEERAKTAVELKNIILKTAAVLVEYRDDPTGGHIDRIQNYVACILDEMRNQGIYTDELSVYDFDVIIQTSGFHDVGKVAIKESILLKPGRLTDAEFEEVKMHTIIGKEIAERAAASAPNQAVANQRFFQYAKAFAVAHHEQWNGKGYPYGLSGRAIPLMGRIMAIADVYDALISERPYKSALSHEKAVEIIMADKGKQFDPVLSDVFYKVSDEFKNIKE